MFNLSLLGSNWYNLSSVLHQTPQTGKEGLESPNIFWTYLRIRNALWNTSSYQTPSCSSESTTVTEGFELHWSDYCEQALHCIRLHWFALVCCCILDNVLWSDYHGRAIKNYALRPRLPLQYISAFLRYISFSTFYQNKIATVQSHWIEDDTLNDIEKADAL